MKTKNYSSSLLRNIALNKRLINILFGIGIVAIIAAGSAYYRIETIKTEDSIKSDLKSFIKMTVAAVNPNRLEALKDSPEDIGTTDYERLRTQLRNIFIANDKKNLRWLYGMDLKDDRIIFTVDSIPVGDFGHSNPGDEYASMSPNFKKDILRAYNNGETVISDPYTDEWGSFISVVSPVIDPKTGKVVGVIGADMDYENYIAEIKYRQGVVFFGTSAILLIFIIGYILFYFINRLFRRISEENSLMESMTSGIKDGVVLVDDAGKIIFCNDSAAKMNGEEKKNLIGGYCFEKVNILDKEDKIIPLSERLLMKIIDEKRTINISLSDKMKMMTKDGVIFPITATLSPVIFGDGCEGGVAVFRDASREEEADKMKTEFLSIASHQLLTPVTIIRYLSESLARHDEGMDTKQKHYIQSINYYSHKMADLIRSLLDISRIESGRLNIRPEPTDLKDLMHDSLSQFKIWMAEKAQGVNLKMDESIPKANIDPMLMREVFSNIISNAIKYSPCKSFITIEMKISEDEIIISFSDSGYGIPEEDREKIFNKFYRGKNINKENNRGSGLGLYLVKEIMDLFGGTISFESEQGKGTTFYLNLPILGIKTEDGTVKLTDN